MNCITCKRYFKHTAFNKTQECDHCLDTLDNSFDALDSELQVDVSILRNPSGRTSPVFYDEYNDPEMDCRDSV